MSSLVPRTRGAWSTSTQGARKLEPVETFLKEVRSSGWVGGRGAWFKEPGYWQRRSWFRDKLPKPKQLQWVLPFPSMGDSWVTYTVINCLPWLSPGQRLLMGNQAKKKKIVHVLSLSQKLEWDPAYTLLLPNANDFECYWQDQKGRGNDTELKGS